MGRRTKQSSSFWYSRSRSSSAPATPRPEPAAATAKPPVGCMSMLHYLIFAPGASCLGRPPTSSSNGIDTLHDCHCRRGGHWHNDRRKSRFEATRSSLDLDADNTNDIQICMQIQQVFDALATRTGNTTSMRRPAKPTAPLSEVETPRMPSLMGIDDLLDQQPSPSPASAQRKKPVNTG